MKVLMTETENGVVIKLEGKMMLGYSANDFHEAVLNAIEKNKNVVVDLSDVQFITSWGVGILMYGYTTATNKGKKFKLASATENIMEVLRKIKLDDFFDKYDSVENALND